MKRPLALILLTALVSLSVIPTTARAQAPRKVKGYLRGHSGQRLDAKLFVPPR